MADKSVGELIAAKSVTPTDLFVLEQNGTAKKLTGQILENWLVSFADGHGGIQSIVKHSTSGLKDTYRITLADTTTFDIIVTNGKAISSVEQTSEEGLTRTYTIAFNDNTSQTFTVTDGRSITNIEKTATNVLTDTYTISYNDGTTSTFTVKNGKGISSFAKVSTVGLVDTYRIEYNDGTSDEFTVTNGAKGDKGDNQYVWIKYASQKPTASSHSFGDVADNWIGIYSGDSATAPTDWTQYEWFQWKGDKGDPGEPAKRLSVTAAYQVGDDGNIIPSGSWLSSIPYVAPGKYLWIRKTTVWNKGDPDVDYSVSRMGIDGTGAVSTVAGVGPDANGNVSLTAADVKALPIGGGIMEGPINMNGQPIGGLNAPTSSDQAVNMGYVNQKLRTYSHRSLLRNSHWKVPARIINQRGFTNGIPQDNSYFIDLWQTVQSDEQNISISLSDAGLKIKVLSGTAGIQQHVPAVPDTNLTFFVKIDGIIYAAAISYGIDKNEEIGNGLNVVARWSEGNLIIGFTATQSAANEFTAEWADLFEGEYTITTRPEHRLNDPDVELLVCQAQLQRFRTEPERKTYCEDFRPTMRMTPNGMVSKFEQEVDGVTYYFASAELP